MTAEIPHIDFVGGLVDLARQTDKSLPLSTVIVLIHIAAEDQGIRADILEAKLNGLLPRSALHRALQRLHEGSPSGTANVGQGLGLIRRFSDPKEPRRFRYGLAPSGERLLASNRLMRRIVV